MQFTQVIVKFIGGHERGDFCAELIADRVDVQRTVTNDEQMLGV